MHTIRIGERAIGGDAPCFVIAELSANHGQDADRARRLIRMAKACGADAVKLQTYTADTLTIDCDNRYFTITEGPWKGQTLHELYRKASTPWEWQADLFREAADAGILCFSTPFDATAVDFLEGLGAPAYKIASFEITDLPLLRRVAATGKPVILSTGMGTLAEIEEAVAAIRGAGNDQLALLKCVSSYPADPASMNLATMEAMALAFGVPVGLSDHSLRNEVAFAAVAMGAAVVEKHIIDDRASGGPDAHFSADRAEFTALVDGIRLVEAARGRVVFGPTGAERENIAFRRSLFATADIAPGQVVTADMVRSIRPGHGVSPKHLDQILGKRSPLAIARGTPITPGLLARFLEA